MKPFIWALVFLCWAGQAVSGPLSNQLKHDPSPYLALHGEDPVHWQAWGEAVLARARAENKPIYISSGYFSCHWCHVMQRESYRDEAIAALLNKHFIPVKIDRELQPALDGHLIEFVRRTQGNSGWPLNVFLTPDGYPLLGFTYAPPERFGGILERVAGLWAARGSELAETARAALAAWSSGEPPRPFEGEPDRPRLAQDLVAAALALGDGLEGGFGIQSRFPMSPHWRSLLNRVEGEEETPLRALILLTLDQMASQGMRDHLAGGFFRYTVDPGWQVPHFEKMLYNQAGLARLYLAAGRRFDRDEYLEVARDTLLFAIRVFQEDDGGFISSLSAIDPRDVEGGGYLWSEEELRSLLDPRELAFAQQRWGLTAGRALENGLLPVDHLSPEAIAAETGRNPADLRALEAGIRQKLLDAKADRRHPRDGKKLAAWNGLMLSALADGVRAFGAPAFVAAGTRLRDYLVRRLWNGERLARAMGPQGEIGRAGLEDYAYVAAGLRDWGQLRNAEEDLRLSERLVSEAWRRFHTDSGWRSTDRMLLPGLASEPLISDDALPSPSAMVIEMSLEGRDPGAVEKARLALRIGYLPALEEPLWHASHVDLHVRRGFGDALPALSVPHTGAVQE